jgi:hypothetical protein
VTRHLPEGAVILRRDDAANAVWFIASGAVEVEVAGQDWRLGRGEMFGHLALLTRAARRARVTAITPCTLLVLDQSRFLRLLARSPALRAAVRASAEKRGLDPDRVVAEAGPVTTRSNGAAETSGSPTPAGAQPGSVPPALPAPVPAKDDPPPSGAVTESPRSSESPSAPRVGRERSWDGS